MRQGHQQHWAFPDLDRKRIEKEQFENLVLNRVNSVEPKHMFEKQNLGV